MKDSFIDELIRAEGFIPAELQAVPRSLNRMKGMKPGCNTSGERTILF